MGQQISAGWHEVTYGAPFEGRMVNVIGEIFEKVFSRVPPKNGRVRNWEIREILLSQWHLEANARLTLYHFFRWLPDMINGDVDDVKMRKISTDIPFDFFSFAQKELLSFINERERCNISFVGRLYSNSIVKDETQCNFSQSSKWLILTVGVAGSGKTTYIEENYSNFCRISMDEVRGRLSLDPADAIQSKLAYRFALPILDKTLSLGKSSIWDATSLTAFSRKNIISKAKKYGAFIKIVFFDLPIEEIMTRNVRRIRKVPDNVIIRQWKKLEPPHRYEADKIEIIGLDYRR